MASSRARKTGASSRTSFCSALWSFSSSRRNADVTRPRCAASARRTADKALCVARLRDIFFPSCSSRETSCGPSTRSIPTCRNRWRVLYRYNRRAKIGRAALRRRSTAGSPLDHIASDGAEGGLATCWLATCWLALGAVDPGAHRRHGD